MNKHYSTPNELGISLDKVGTTPNKSKYANALLPSKQAEFNNINNYNKGWKLETYSTYIDIFSSQRNKNLYPHSNFYSIKLPQPIRNVFSIEIIRGSIPKGEYTINQNNNIFVVKKGPTTFQITLEDGDYDMIAFVAYLNTILAFLNIVVVFNALLSKLDFSCVDPDIITFFLSLPKSPYIELGIPPQNINWQNQYRSPNRIDLFGSQELEILMNELGTVNNIIQCVYFRQDLSVVDFDYNNSIVRVIDPHQEFFNITLQFYNKRYNRLYNFNGLENYICMKFKSHKYVSPILIPELKSV